MCISVIFSDFVLPAVSIHSHNTRYASDQNLYRIHVRTNYGKFTFKCRAAKFGGQFGAKFGGHSLNSFEVGQLFRPRGLGLPKPPRSEQG